MNYLGVCYEMSHRPKLDPEFIPFGRWMTEYERGAEHPIAIAVERNDGFIFVRHAKIHNTAEMAQADLRFVERHMKFLLWSIGGFRVYICGCSTIAQRLQQVYSPAGERAFDCDFFFKLYERPMEIIDLPLDRCPASNEQPRPIGDVPIVVANDGDVTALAGAMGMGCGSIMGPAMGTSEDVGYVDKDKNVLGRVMSGKGGEEILTTCQNVLADEFPALSRCVQVMLPDYKTRRVYLAGHPLDEN